MLAYQAVIGDMELWAFNVLFSELCVSICLVDGLNVGIYSMFFCSKNELHFHDVIKLFRDDLQSEGPDGTQLVTLGYILCLILFLYQAIGRHVKHLQKHPFTSSSST